MSRNSVKSSKGRAKPLRNKGISEVSRKKAIELASHYGIVIRPQEPAGYVGTVLEYPTIFSTGKTQTDCMRSTLNALEAGLASLIDEGVTLREPFGARSRTEQMNIRLDAEEKLLLRETALARGFRSASDYVRAIALTDARRLTR